MIKIENLSIKQGDFELKDIDLTINEGEYCVLMGASGSGKTTIMEVVLGLRDIQQGTVIIGNQNVTNLVPAMRRVGYVPQDGALFPTMKVGDQIAFPQVVQKKTPEEITKNVKELAEQLNIGHLLERMPGLLSGGEKQRVALARALAMNPVALCFDEPLSALDEELHEEVCDLLKKTVEGRKLTCLHITHSRKEALAVADVAYKIYNGRISQFDLTPDKE